MSKVEPPESAVEPVELSTQYAFGSTAAVPNTHSASGTNANESTATKNDVADMLVPVERSNVASAVQTTMELPVIDQTKDRVTHGPLPQAKVVATQATATDSKLPAQDASVVVLPGGCGTPGAAEAFSQGGPAPNGIPPINRAARPNVKPAPMPPLVVGQSKRQPHQPPRVSIASASKAKPRTWDESYRLLEKYKQENGNCNVPKRYKDDPGLGRWVSKVRSQRKRDKLDKEQTQKLEALGFDWDDRHKARVESQWQSQMKALMEYKKEHGDCLVPQAYPVLGHWVSKQRVKNHRRRLDPEQKAALGEVGFVWEIEDRSQRDTSKFDVQWNKKYDELVAFHAKHGHWTLSTKNNKPLARWASNQRTIYKQNQLPQWRIDKLEKVGFPWVVVPDLIPDGGPKVPEPQKEKADEARTSNNIGKATGTVNSDHADDGTGNDMPPLKQPTGSNQPAGGDTNAKQSDGTDNISRQERLDRLWEDKLSLLLAYKKEYGDCLVPQPYWKDPSLSTWVSKQRVKRKNAKLPPDRESRLETIGFVWEIRQKEHRESERFAQLWQSQYSQLAAMYKDTGKCVPPHSNKTLVRWVHHQRKTFRLNKLRDDRKKLLDKIKFAWTPERSGATTDVSTQQHRKRKGRPDGKKTDRVVRGKVTDATTSVTKKTAGIKMEGKEGTKDDSKAKRGRSEESGASGAATQLSKRRRIGPGKVS